MGEAHTPQSMRKESKRNRLKKKAKNRRRKRTFKKRKGGENIVVNGLTLEKKKISESVMKEKE